MSSERARYELSAAEMARLAEEAARRDAQREWAQERLARLMLRQTAERNTRLLGSEAVKVETLGELRGDTSTEMRHQLDAAKAVTVELKSHVEHQRRLGEDRLVHELIAALPALPEAEVAGSTAAEATDRDRENDLAEAARVLARVETLVGVRPPELEALVATMVTGSAARRAVLLARLRREESGMVAALAIRTEERKALAFAEAVIEQTGDAALTSALRAAQREFEALRPVQTAALRALAESAVSAYEQEQRRAFAERMVVAAFAELDYEVVSGYEVGTPAHGVLVRRRRGSARAIQIKVNESTISVTPTLLVPRGVAARSERDADERAEDRLNEQAVCADASRVWANVSRVSSLTGPFKVEGLMPGAVEVAEDLLTTGGATDIGVTKERRIP